MLSSPLNTKELAIQMILDGALRLSCLGAERDIKEIEAMKTFITKEWDNKCVPPILKILDLCIDLVKLSGCK